jgi:hypothetical protein
MRHILGLFTGLVLAAGLLAGCGKGVSPTGPGGPAGTSNDQTQVASQIAGNPQYVEDGLFEGEDPTPASTAPAIQPEGALADIQPINFWRHITDVRRTFEYAFGDTDSTGRPTRAVVTVNRVLTGTFNIQAPSPADSVFGRHVIRKPLKDFWTRRITLRRVSVPESEEPQWRIVGLSGVRVVSRNAETKITSLRVQAADLDTTIADPLAFTHLRRVLRFAPDEDVTLTVTTLRDDDVVVLQRRDRRFRFRNNGDNTHTGVFRAAFLEGVHHVGVNALSHGTLYDDGSPYDSQAWLFPCVAHPIPIAFREP